MFVVVSVCMRASGVRACVRVCICVWGIDSVFRSQAPGLAQRSGYKFGKMGCVVGLFDRLDDRSAGGI